MRARFENLCNTIGNLVVYGKQPGPFFNESQGQQFLKKLAAEDEKLKAEALKKSTYIMWASGQNIPDSILHTSRLPREIALHIARDLYSVMNKNCFFTLEALNSAVPNEAKEEQDNKCGL